MRFTFAETMCDPQHLPVLAREAEQAGYHSFAVPDSVCYPRDSDSTYPYTEDGGRGFLEDKPLLDPFVLMGALGAVTTTLRFTTFVVKLPIRHPVLVAKQATSVAVLTQNRFAFGVGLSPWPDDFRIMNQPWEHRGARMNEMIEIVRGLSRGGFFEFHGKHYDLEPIKLCPVPTKPLPILIGGHSDAALRRAARLGDGWMHGGGGKAADLDGALARLQALRREYGREREPFEIHVISMDAFSRDGVKRLEDRGVTDVVLGVRDPYRGPDQPLQQKIDALRGLADMVVQKGP
jgi:probable F420-dependent oxidoreductase